MHKLIEKLLLFPKLIIAFFFLLTSLASVLVIFNYLEVNTSTDSLINKNLKFKQDQRNLKKDFKILENNILIKISGDKSELKKTAQLIIDDLKKEKN